MQYFKGYQNVFDTVLIYKNNDKDVLLEQNVILLDTYERIKLNVELEKNYIFDFLTDFDWLENKFSVNDIQISYNTTFDEELYLYKTFTKFNYKGYVYKVYFEMEGEIDWQGELSNLLA